MVTIRDVASTVGVSITTVSRALAEPDRVAPATRERVVRAAAELGYRPNRAASGLRAGRTHAVGLLIPDLTNPYFAEVATGTAQRARARGYAVFVADAQEDPATEIELLSELASQTDGVVLCSPRAAEAEAIGEARVVVVNHELPGMPSLALDDRTGAWLALEHLAAQGHRRIAYAGGPARSWSDQHRHLGVVDACADLPGLEPLMLGPFSPTIDGGREAAGVALAQHATAVITFNDVMALGLVRRLRSLGLRVPHDMSVVSFDDTYLAEVFDPGLTSVKGDLRALGGRAVDVLLDPDSSPVVERAPVRLVIRESTSPLLGRRS